MSKIAIITCIFGDYDELRENQQYQVVDNEELEFVCFTDRKYETLLWRLHIDTTKESRLASRYYKMQGWRYIDADYFIYLNGSYNLACAPQELVGKHLDEKTDAFFYIHQDRYKSCAYKEGSFFTSEYPAVKQQLVEMREAGFPEGYGLIHAAAFGWKNNERTQKFFDLWCKEFDKYPTRDQISLPYALWKSQENGLKYKVVKEFLSNENHPNNWSEIPLTKDFKAIGHKFK